MVEQRPESPVFGQNGAVLNSQTMTDELRTRYAAAEQTDEQRFNGSGYTRSAFVFQKFSIGLGLVSGAISSAKDLYPVGINLVLTVIVVGVFIFWGTMAMAERANSRLVRFLDHSLHSLACTFWLFSVLIHWVDPAAGRAAIAAALLWYARRWLFHKTYLGKPYRPFS